MSKESQNALQAVESTPLNIVVAHGLEAKALIPMLQLQTLHSKSPFVEYSNSNKLHLIVSGIGTEAVVAAVTHLSQRQINDEGAICAWLNIGIAGHRTAPLGSAWLGNKITSQITGVSAYPPQLIQSVASGRVITVDEPEQEYPEDAAYEMEAAAFYDEATKHSTAELVQVFKIISDNLENPIGKMGVKNIPGWIEQQSEQITTLISKMSGLAEQYNVSHGIPEIFRDVCSRTHLTANQKLQLKRFCVRYRALGLETDLETVVASAGNDSKEILATLAAGLERKDYLR